jgi:hypothetical protein
MQLTLRHDILRALYYAEPVDEISEELNETELTKAARSSVDNANRIIEGEAEFKENDFKPKQEEQEAKKQADQKRKKAHKQERKRKQKARKRK